MTNNQIINMGISERKEREKEQRRNDILDVSEKEIIINHFEILNHGFRKKN